jgi:hypothetical protein
VKGSSAVTVVDLDLAELGHLDRRRLDVRGAHDQLAPVGLRRDTRSGAAARRGGLAAPLRVARARRTPP